MSRSYDCDVAVVGAGPAGSAAAAALRKAKGLDLDVMVLEGDRFPRHHIGESLVPAANRILQAIGVLDKVQAARYPEKEGATWTVSGINGDGEVRTARTPFDKRFIGYPQGPRHYPDLPKADLTKTVHVDRASFDAALAEHAERLGAKVEQGARVIAAVFDADGVTLTVRRGRDGETWRVRARMLVDASGRGTFLGSKLGLKQMDPVFNQYAVYTYYEGLNRAALAGDGEEGDIVIHFSPADNTWMWQIPISERVTSVGVVTQKSALREHGGDAEKLYWNMVATRPELLRELRAARRTDKFRVEGDYSYGMKQICGDRYVLVGDAARFVDPIFSSGVSIALHSAWFAAQAIIAAFTATKPDEDTAALAESDKDKADLSKAAFARFEDTMRVGMNNWYRFISLYYRLNMIFTVIAKDPKWQTDLLGMLQGDVYHEENPAVLDHMSRIVKVVEDDPDHLWHPYLGTLRAPMVAPQF